MQFKEPQVLGSIKWHEIIKDAKKRVNMTLCTPVSTSLRLRCAYIPWDQRRVKGIRDCGKGGWNMAVLVYQRAVSSAGQFHSSKCCSWDARCFNTSLALNHCLLLCTQYCTWPLSCEPACTISSSIYSYLYVNLFGFYQLISSLSAREVS